MNEFFRITYGPTSYFGSLTVDELRRDLDRILHMIAISGASLDGSEILQMQQYRDVYANRIIELENLNNPLSNGH
jgi:hypothetical protein